VANALMISRVGAVLGDVIPNSLNIHLSGSAEDAFVHARSLFRAADFA
jgi:hypothetical protein